MCPVCITRGLHDKTHNAYATEKVFQRETSLITSARNTFVFNNIQRDELHSQLITIHHILIFSATIWHNRARSNTAICAYRHTSSTKMHALNFTIIFYSSNNRANPQQLPA